MRPVSSMFLDTITGSHKVVARAVVCPTFQTGTTPTGTEIRISGGNVELRGTADIRGTLELTTPAVDTDGGDMWPRLRDSLLAPYGNEVFVSRGVEYHDGSRELVGLGYFRIETVEQDDAPDGTLLITGRDRMAGLVDARLTEPRQFAAGVTLGSIMTALVTEVYPDAVIEWDDNTDADVLTRALICERDRFAFLDDLVRARGKIWRWDHKGALTILTAPSSTAPVWEVHAGAGGVLVSASRVLSRLGAYNAVVAEGEATDTQAPVRAVEADLNPRSPTFFRGRFGPVPRFYFSPFLTASTVQAAAREMLRRQLGLAYGVDFSAVPNPALEDWDPVSLRTGRRQGRETHVIESVRIPLVPGAEMTSQTREQTVVLIGGV